MKPKKCRHKTDGWTGTITIDPTYWQSTGRSSHRCTLIGKIDVEILIDPHKPNGEYVEDITVESLDELEILDEN